LIIGLAYKFKIQIKESKFSVLLFVYYSIFYQSLLTMCIIAFHFKLTKKLLGLINYQAGASARSIYGKYQLYH